MTWIRGMDMSWVSNDNDVDQRYGYDLGFNDNDVDLEYG
jgi:hypothetical protein